MKKILIAALAPALIATAFCSSAAVTVDGGKINFAGSVVAAPCAVDNDSESQTVTLGQVATNKLVAKGDSSSAVNFNINLTGCDLTTSEALDPTQTANYTKASIIFNGATLGESTTLALAGSGAGESVAKNVGIQIFHANQAVTVDGSSATVATSLVAGKNSIPFSVAYVATDANVVAGSANSTVNFQVSYD
ncbi:fimbrial protein [Erwinia billingiae]|uniref:fimbrial protein n=1 Tax=Erwinia billingiae TaxID=182337 RepID=UPI003209BD59